MTPAALARSIGADWIGTAPHEDQRRSRPLLPSDDPFYEPPPGFHHAAPGTVLRSRDVELGFLGLVPQKFSATQLLYRTNDRNGRPEAAVTTVLVPSERGPENVCPLISYQCAIDAVSARCFPSYALRRWSFAPGSLAQFELLLIAAALSEGWAVSVPDHEGTNGHWGVPYEPGYRVLDGLRAATSYETLGLSPDSQIGLWGYSGGGLATAWASETSADYAPELDIVGAVLGSPVGNLGNTFKRLNGAFFAGLPTMVIAALAKTYPEMDRVIQRHATEDGRSMLKSAEKWTTAAAVIKMRNKDIDDYVNRPLDEILDEPEMKYVFDDIKLGTAAPSRPVLIIQAVHDSLISVDDIDELAESYRAGGAAVTYHRDVFSDHMLLHPMSAPMALRWLRDRFAGRPLSAHLIRTTWPTLLNPSAYRGLARLGVIAAKLISGRRIKRRPLSEFDD